MHIIESQVSGYGKVYRGTDGWYSCETEATVFDYASTAQGAIERMKQHKWLDVRTQEAWNNATIKGIA